MFCNGNPMNEFRPLPLLGNPHVQTLLGTWLPGPRLKVASRRRVVTLCDGDRIVLHDHVPEAWRAGDRIALLVHGMSGSAESGYMRRVAGLLLPSGIRAIRMDLRGCGHGLALARKTYNAAC